MKFIETKRLNDYIMGTENLLGAKTPAELSAGLCALQPISLQDFSIEHDRNFLREVSAVLNVIVSIIYHPHLANKHEEVIIRIEQAQQLSREDFFDTVRDTRLWKEHDVRMIPEEVHYHQHIDELRIYENRFVGFLVDVIDRELSKFSAFYLSRLPTVASLSTPLDHNEVGAVIMEVDRLRRKTQFIKNTYFYKEVSKGKPISHKIQPTNILLKDRLYRFCFRFYKEFARFEDVKAATKNLKDYYLLLLLRELERSGFSSVSVSEHRYVYENEEFTLTFETEREGAVALNVLCHAAPESPARHLLDVCAETESLTSEIKGVCLEEWDGAERISVWELLDVESDLSRGMITDTEEALICRWLKDKIHKIKADPSIYKKYCPVCRSRGLEHSEEIYFCPTCASSYVFDGEGAEATVWFKKIRKGHA